MIDLIKQLISNNKAISSYKIVETKIEAGELFFVKKTLDMNRAKEVSRFSLTIYKDFEENGIKYKGSSTAIIHPTMSEKEISACIDDAAFAAGFVKNEYYPLPKPTSTKPVESSSNLYKHSIKTWLPKIAEAVYEKDTLSNGCINSAEIFLNKVYTRIINSEGIDVSFENYKGEVEFITDWNEREEKVELYKRYNFSEFNSEALTEAVSEQLMISREKALAKPTPMLNKFTVLLTGEPVKDIFYYYYMQSSAENVYDESSKAKLNKNIQGDEVKGDLVNISLNPQLENSTNSASYDNDGYPLQTVQLYKNGILKNYWGDFRHSHYLKIQPTGIIKNIVVDGGSLSIADFKKEPYLELVAFSDFQMDDLTGDFGGEIRLGWYFDGKNTIPVTGGSISGNIKEAQKAMYLSKELQKNNSFFGPKTIKLENISVSGID